MIDLGDLAAAYADFRLALGSQESLDNGVEFAMVESGFAPGLVTEFGLVRVVALFAELHTPGDTSDEEFCAMMQCAYVEGLMTGVRLREKQAA